jgi:hypothetical protein
MIRRQILALLPFGLALTLLLSLGGCGRPHAWGDTNSLIVGADDVLWEEIQEEVEEALEPRAFTVRNERIFNLSQSSPRESRWARLREFRQVLLIGSESDPWIATALDRARAVPTERPALVQAHDVWARGQLVTIFLVSADAPAEGARALLPEARALLLEQFRDYSRRRMFASGADTVGRDTLARTAGFSILLPRVYVAGRSENVLVFRNDFPDPSELIRSVLVTWREVGTTPVSAEAALDWREEVAQRFYDPPPVTERERIESGEVEVGGAAGVEVRGAWSSPPDAWPAGGPFITRIVRCPGQNRDYLLDSWVYAPGRDKYEYLVQLETILDTFDCRHPLG